ncbi:MAG TPA: AEC family transporter [Anaerolineales bacterium]|nr:AEC family transporter [Anaerolineales bacterium]
MTFDWVKHMSFSVLAATFANNILPIILLSGAGFALGKLLHIDPRSLGRVVFYVFSPVLIFDVLVQNQLRLTDAAVVIVYALCFIFVIGALTFVVGYFLKLDRPALVAILITTMFANTGNYGLPLVSFAFGEEALSYAGIYFITTTVLFYTFGVFLASLGHMSFREALVGIFRIPMMYAVVLAILINILNVDVPTPISRAVDLAAGGTIPLMLVLLGVQLTQVEFSGNQRALQLSVSLRLVIAPLLALLFASLFGLQSISRQASVTQASMPSMVSATVLAAEYNLDSKLVTAVVFISTLLSPFTLTPLLVFLGR